MEKIDMKKVRCQAKVVGTAVTVAGAMVMTLYKGPIMEMVWTKHIHPHKSVAPDTTDKDWFKGSIFVIIATLAWAFLFVLQVPYLPTYLPTHQYYTHNYIIILLPQVWNPRERERELTIDRIHSRKFNLIRFH